jgi:hypothetical protein
MPLNQIVYALGHRIEFGGFEARPGRTARGAVRLHRRILGTACLVCDLARIGSTRDVGESEGVDSDDRDRRIFHFCAHADNVEIDGPHRIIELVTLVSVPLIISMVVAIITVQGHYGFSSVNTIGLFPIFLLGKTLSP